MHCTYPIQQLNLKSAHALSQLAIELAEQRHAKIAVAVVDPAGHLLSFQRMDRCILVAIDVAIGKARTAAYLGRPAKAFETMIEQGHSSLLSIKGLTPLAGGIPVCIDGELIGAIGISGDTGEVDELIANQSVEAFVHAYSRSHA